MVERAREPGVWYGRHSDLARLCKTGAARGGCQWPAACLHVPWASAPEPRTIPCGAEAASGRFWDRKLGPAGGRVPVGSPF